MDPWFPRGLDLEDTIKTRRLLFDGSSYQIYSLTGKGSRVLFVRKELARSWVDDRLMNLQLFTSLKYGTEDYYYLTSDDRVLSPVSACPSPDGLSEAMSFATSLRRTRSIVRDKSLSEAIYVEKYSLLLPTPAMEHELDDAVVLGRYLCGGGEVSCFSTRRLTSLVRGLSESDLKKIIDAAGLSMAEGETQQGEICKRETETRSKFSLIGRPQLETFFLDHVIDIIENQERYRALGINFPSAIVLHGAPGCGKTYAVERLVEYLDWPIFTIDSGSIGSKYLHETSQKIAGIFQTAMEQSPSVIVIDEMDAFLAERGAGGEYRAEEVSEFLRKIPEAAKHQVLLIGMTNRLDMVDPAILRAGRFDHIIEVDMATDKEIFALITKLFSEKPHTDDIDLKVAAETLAGRPLSDVAYFVREAARLAARSGKPQIDSDAAKTALSSVFGRKAEPERPRIGFM